MVSTTKTKPPLSAKDHQPPPPPPSSSKMALKVKPHPHAKLKQRANQAIAHRPKSQRIINRLLNIYNKTTGKKETLKSLLNNQQTRDMGDSDKQ